MRYAEALTTLEEKQKTKKELTMRGTLYSLVVT